MAAPPPPPPPGRKAARALFLLLLLLLLFLPEVPLLGSAAPGPPRPSCHTDFASVLRCAWDQQQQQQQQQQRRPPEKGAQDSDEDEAEDCARDFRLRHSARRRRGPAHPWETPEEEPEEEEEEEAVAPCGPEEEEDEEEEEEAALREGVPRRRRQRCSCAFPRRDFRLVRFRLALERRQGGGGGGPWRTLWTHEMDAEGAVKPRPLVNLTVAKKTDHSFVLSWRWDYPPGSLLRGAKAEYQVAYWPKGQEGKGIKSTSSSATYEIFANRLLPASDYVAKVRFRLEEWGNLWSKWSAPFKWHNEFGSGEEPWKLTLWSCVPLVAMLLTCYLSFTRVKRDWWDQIPSPAKSKMAQSMTMFPPLRRIPCKGITFPPGPSQGDDKDSLSKTAATTATAFAPSALQEMVPGGGGNPGPKPEVFLTPEVAVIECPLVICSRTAEAKPEDWKEEDEEQQILHQDVVAGLFQDLLNGDFSTGDTRVLEAPAARDGGDMGSSGGLPLDRIPGAPNLHLEASSESGYQSSGGAEAVLPPPLRSPPGPEHHLSQDCASPPLDMLGYRSISSLVTQPVASSNYVEDAPHSGQIQPCSPQPELQNTLLASPGTQWLLATVPALDPKQGASPGHPTWVAPGKLSVLTGYRSFTSALQDGSPAQEGDSGGSSNALALTPPYRPLLSLLRSSDNGPFSLEESQGAESLAWPEGPCHPMQA